MDYLKGLYEYRVIILSYKPGIKSGLQIKNDFRYTILVKSYDPEAERKAYDPSRRQRSPFFHNVFCLLGPS